jgi:hypothetical protein
VDPDAPKPRARASTSFVDPDAPKPRARASTSFVDPDAPKPRAPTIALDGAALLSASRVGRASAPLREGPSAIIRAVSAAPLVPSTPAVGPQADGPTAALRRASFAPAEPSARKPTLAVRLDARATSSAGASDASASSGDAEARRPTLAGRSLSVVPPKPSEHDTVTNPEEQVRRVRVRRRAADDEGDAVDEAADVDADDEAERGPLDAPTAGRLRDVSMAAAQARRQTATPRGAVGPELSAPEASLGPRIQFVRSSDVSQSIAQVGPRKLEVRGRATGPLGGARGPIASLVVGLGDRVFTLRTEPGDDAARSAERLADKLGDLCEVERVEVDADTCRLVLGRPLKW